MHHNLPDQLVQSDSIQLGDIGVLPDLNNGETISSPVEHVMDEEYYTAVVYTACSLTKVPYCIVAFVVDSVWLSCPQSVWL